MPGWGSSTLYAPRRSHEISSHRSSPSPLSEDSVESSPRRMSSEITPRPPPATTRFLSSPTNEQAAQESTSSSSRRLGYIADKLTSSLTGSNHHHNTNSKQSLHPHHLPVLHGSHQHSRSDPNQGSTSPSPMSSNTAVASPSKSHTSPSKASYGRTYDSKLVSREMHRLGNLGHIPSALAPPITSAPSVASLNVPAPTSQANLTPNSSNDPWGALHVHVLPLFNGEPLRIPIEDLNTLVKRHIQTVVPSAPQKALTVLENNASELIAAGMVTLNAKLIGIDDTKLVARVVEIWGFFWDQVLTYIEGVLLPLQTDPLLSSLHRAPKPHHRATSPVRQATKGSISSALSGQTSATPIDVRSVALRSFRDRVILPLFSRLHVRLSMPSSQDQYQETSAYQQPRLQQMLLVLASQRRQRPIASLTTPIPPPTPGEAAIADLLHVVRNPRSGWESGVQNSKKMGPMSPLARAPSFLSGAQPRDRRGRIALKKNGKRPAFLTGLQADEEDDQGLAADRDREREFLEALRSPDGHMNAARGSVGGWGLGAGHEDPGSDEEELVMDMRQAQEEVERMVGMSSPPPPPPPSKGKI